MKNNIKANNSFLKLGSDGEIQNNVIKYVRNLFKVKKKQTKN